jgi:hypothetical protein
MSGISWSTIGADKFENVVDILLAREFGIRGHAVDGRGGDGGVDYEVDDGEIIFQYKYFWNGITVSRTRKAQIEKSFKKAMEHDREEWILVVPAKLTPQERRFITGLGKGKNVKITIRDRVWLDDQLIKNRDLAENLRFGSDIDLLYEKGERFKYNPVIRDGADVADRMGAIRDALDMADPNWTFDVYSTNGQTMQILRPKDPNAPLRSPIEGSFTAQLRAESAEAKDLEVANAFGLTKPIIFTSGMIKEFKINSPRLVAWEGIPDAVELHPPRDSPEEWKAGELLLRDGAGEQLGLYLVDIRQYTEGVRGFTLLARLGSLLDLTFRCPYELGTSSTDLTAGNFTGKPINEAFEIADFMVQFAAASTLEVGMMGRKIALLDVEDRVADRDLVGGFEAMRALLYDLKAIEAETKARFRFPGEITLEERIMARSLRLMLEGHCVAHPRFTQFVGELNGADDPGLKQVLTTDPHWTMQTREPAVVRILGQEVVIPKLAMAAAVSLTKADVDDLRAAFERGDAAGKQLTLHVRPGDRVRMFLPDRFPLDKPLDITPWGLPGVEQKGLGPDGEPLAASETREIHPGNMAQ